MNAPNWYSLVGLLRARADQASNRQAYSFLSDGETEADRMTYAEIDQRSRAIAFMLQRRHKPGERALLLYPAGLEFVCAFFGCLYAGIVAVPAYPPKVNGSKRGLSRIRAIVHDADISIVLCDDRIIDQAPQIMTEIPRLGRVRWLSTVNVPLNDASHWHEPEIYPDTIAFLQYTSGSTSEPKGVMVSHGNLLSNLSCIAQAEENDAASVSVSWLPVYHDMGLIEAVLQPLYGEYPAYLMPSSSFLQKPVRWLKAISKYRATNSGGPNFAFELCVRRISPEERQQLDLNCWRVAYNGAEPIRWKTLKAFYDAFKSCGFRWSSFYPTYGLAEATLLVSSGNQAYEPKSVLLRSDRLAQGKVERAVENSARPVRIVSCGPISSGTTAAIVDPVSLRPSKPGNIGEIWLKNKSVAIGYWNRPSETQHTFNAYLSSSDEGPFLRTGDLGFVDGKELFVTGRIKDLIVIRGLKHYPQDIEISIEDCHPAIRKECTAAFSVETDGEERLVLAAEVDRRFLRSRQDDSVVISAMRQTLSERHGLNLFAAVLLRPCSLPKTSSGKIQRQLCKIRFLAGKLHGLAEQSTASNCSQKSRLYEDLTV